MLRLLSTTLLLVLCAIYSASQELKLTDLIKAPETNKFLGFTLVDTTKLKAPNGVVLMAKNVTELGNGKSQVWYEFGNRIYGDKIVAFSEDYQANIFTVSLDLRLVLRYPDSDGLGAHVTYGLIMVEADNALGEAYIIEGGVGERYIAIEVLAYATQSFRFDADIFGI